MAIKSKDELKLKGQAPGGKRNLRENSFPWARIDNIIGSGAPVVVPPPINALQFDGVNDYVTNDPSTPLPEWERTQPRTFYTSVDIGNPGTNRVFYSTRNLAARGLLFDIIATDQIVVSISSGAGNRINMIGIPVIGVGKHTVQVTYDGSSTGAGVTVYVDTVVYPMVLSEDTLAGTIINGLGKLYMGIDLLNPGTFFFQRMRRLSFVDYIKTPAEILTDHGTDTQSVGTGNYLFAADFNRTSGLNFLTTSTPAFIMDVIGQPGPNADWVLR